MGKYDDLDSGIVRKTPHWVPCTHFIGPWGEHFSYGVDWDEVERFMDSIPQLECD